MCVEEAFDYADQRVVARDIIHGRPALRANVGVLPGIAVAASANVVLAWHQCDWPVHHVHADAAGHVLGHRGDCLVLLGRHGRVCDRIGGNRGNNGRVNSTRKTQERS